MAAKIAAEAVGGEGAAASCIGANSFTGDTPVLMADGSSRLIAEVKVGDEVRNSEPDDSFTEHHVVTAVHVTDDDREFVDVTVLTSGGSRMVVTTAHHHFWDETTHTWTDATDLKVGDQLSTPGGGRIAVQRLLRYAASQRTYNLTVDGVHTFYVEAGDTPVLVHNSGCGPRFAVDSNGSVADLANPIIDRTAGVLSPTGKGMVYNVQGGMGLNSRVTQVWIMDPVTNGKYQYPNGYVVYMNRTGQTVNPLTGQTVANSDPYAHIPLS